jgi:uncharacterized protein YutE (UPF0331/DUF86 family)
MDNELIENKLESLRRCVARIESKTPANSALLMNDLDLQDIIVLNLERAVQNCVDIALHILSTIEEASLPSSMAEAFHALQREKIVGEACASRLVKAVGFRNTAVHAYQQVDYEIVYTIITRHLDDFRAFASQIINYMTRESP